MQQPGFSTSELVVFVLFLTIVVIGVVVLLRLPPRSPSATLVMGDAEWDRRLAGVPKDADLRTISDRLHAVERACDVLKAEVGGVKDAMVRVERTVNLLLSKQIERED